MPETKERVSTQSARVLFFDPEFFQPQGFAGLNQMLRYRT
jgi:hypothetical protein